MTAIRKPNRVARPRRATQDGTKTTYPQPSHPEGDGGRRADDIREQERLAHEIWLDDLRWDA